MPYIEQEKHSLLTTEGVVEHHMLNPALYALSTGEVSPENLIDLFSVSGFDVKEVSDDAPFFYKFEAGLHSTLRILLIFSSVAMIFCWIPKSKTNETVETTGNAFYFLLLD